MFDSDLGDTVPLALANAHCVQFVVFTTLECHPVVHLTRRQVKCDHPVYPAYRHTGCGHYNAVTEFSENDSEVQDPQPRLTKEMYDGCNCGKNTKANLDVAHCVPVASKYTTTNRCTCLKNSKQCTHKCRCKNCCNAFGKRPNLEVDGTPCCQRQKHVQQINVPKSFLFGCSASAGEDMTTGKRTVLEFFVLEGILHFLKGQYCESATESILDVYSAAVEITKSFDTTLPIGNKSEEDIVTFLCEHQHNLEAFTSLCNCQLSINMTKQ